MESDNLSSWITIIGSLLFFIFLIILGIYTWIKLKRDLVLYEEAVENASSNIHNASAPTPGANGTDGKSAYDIYLMNFTGPPPPLTLTEFNDKFNGQDGDPGTDAPDAIDGSRGESGSTGEIGEIGKDGGKGISGVNGLDGVIGKTFISFNSDDPLTPTSPTDFNVFPSCEIITYTPPNIINVDYYYDSNKIINFKILFTSNVNRSNGYLSLLIYRYDTFEIIGLTSPYVLNNFDFDQDIIIDINPPPIPTIPVSPPSFPLGYRAVVSLNRGLTESIFTTNVIEKNFENNEFVVNRKQPTDPFVNKVETILKTIPGIDVEFDIEEKCKISQMTITDQMSITNQITINLST